MVIRHNLSSGNSSRNFGINSKNKSKSSEKLSSGYRINRAADDAAGLAISEKMRSQIRGLNQGSDNSQDGISLLQTADGGMQEIHSLLQRCRELAVKSGNGTYNDNDREMIQDEVSELIDQVDTIANDTEFNGLSLLSGLCDKEGKVVPSNSLNDCVQYITTSGGMTNKYTYDDGSQYASAVIDFSNITSADDVAKLVGKGVNYTCCTCTKAYSIKFVSGTPDTSRLNASNPVMEIDVSSITNGTDLVNKIIETAYGVAGTKYNPTIDNDGIPKASSGDIPASATSFVKHYSQLASDGAKLYIYDDRDELANNTWPNCGSGQFNFGVYGEVEELEDKFFYADIQAGSEKGQTVRIAVQNVTTEQLGVQNLKVNTQENAISAIDKLDYAIDKVSESRGIVGGYENRLEHAITSTDNTSENLQNAESRIRDADMAKEIMEYYKDNILMNASQNMLMYANQDTSTVLELLQ